MRLSVLLSQVAGILLLTCSPSNGAYTNPCSYDGRGTLTLTCYNADDTSIFKNQTLRHVDESIRCLNCSFPFLNSGIFNILVNNINSLDLSSSHISTIQSGAFFGLVFLTTLNLNNNAITSIPSGTFSGIKEITSLNLDNNPISILLENGFHELVKLETLTLRENNIQTIKAKAFNGLTNLETLDLSQNYLTQIKGVFNNLPSLRLLNLTNNKISLLSGKDFENLPALKEIYFENNLITSIPSAEFAAMVNLKKLNLCHNLIDKVIAGSFQGLHSLENLDLSFNKLKEIPQKLFNLHNLKNLKISNNHLVGFQTGLYSGLPQLCTLNLAGNSIEGIEITGVISANNLDTLDLSKNKIKDVDYVRLVKRFPSISSLNLAGNVLGCGLGKKMSEYFAKDNFVFVLDEEKKCVEKNETLESVKVEKDHAVVINETSGGTEGSGSGGVKASGGLGFGTTFLIVVLYGLISLILGIVGVICYMQFMLYSRQRRALIMLENAMGKMPKN